MASLSLRLLQPYLHLSSRINPRIYTFHLRKLSLPLRHTFKSFHSRSELHPLLASSTTASSKNKDEDEIIEQALNGQGRIGETILRIAFWASISLLVFAFNGRSDANASAVADSSIKASSFGLTIAGKLRELNWPDEAIVFSLATLPVIELRGAIPVGYWMQLNPIMLTIISIIGNMVPVPLILLFLKSFASFVAARSKMLSRLVEGFFERTKEKAKPVEEFRWLGLMLFVAVPFPGTGAWTGAIIASLVDMPFWPAMAANFCGVVMAGLLVNLLVNIGIMYAVLGGFVLFIASSFMWSALRKVVKPSSTL